MGEVLRNTTLSREEILVLVMEECGEIIQAAAKCLRFGYDRYQEGYGFNDEKLSKEFGDLVGAMDALPLSRELVEQSRVTKLNRAEQAKSHFGVKAGGVTE